MVLGIPLAGLYSDSGLQVNLFRLHQTLKIPPHIKYVQEYKKVPPNRKEDTPKALAASD